MHRQIDALETFMVMKIWFMIYMFPWIMMYIGNFIRNKPVCLVTEKMIDFQLVNHDDVIKWKHFPRYWPFVRESTGHRWIPLTKPSDAELWYFLWSAPEQTVEQAIEALVIWDAIALIMTSPIVGLMWFVCPYSSGLARLYYCPLPTEKIKWLPQFQWSKPGKYG